MCVLLMVLDLVSELKYFYTRFYQCIRDSPDV